MIRTNHTSELFWNQQDKSRTRRVAIVLAFVIALFTYLSWSSGAAAATIIPHPPGCPASRFCACGASVKVFGKAIRSLWPSTAWLRFPRTSPGHLKVAARPGHVFVIDYMIDARTAMAWDYNSGGRKSRYHARSIAGYRIVDPRATRVAMAGAR